MVDDCSKDNSVNLIKELMIKDPRIILFQNKENKGMLYTKTRGVLLAKGKYVLILDMDDIYTQRDAFSTLYIQIFKNNIFFKILI
jgi:glycosyltransferase involved in cell wall biosynthesis